MRVMLVWEYYPGYVRDLYARDAGLADKPFDPQLGCILDDCFGWPSALARRLCERGHEVSFCLANIEPLQRSWCGENAFSFPAHRWQQAIALEQARRFRPDVVWIGSMFSYFGGFLRALRETCRCVVAWIACPTPPDLDLAPFALVLTSHANLAQQFVRQGGNAQVLRPAFEPRILERTENVERDIELSFVGSFSSEHRERCRLLGRLAETTPLRIWGQGVPINPGWHGWRTAAKRLVPGLISGPLDERYGGEAWGRNMYTLLRRSRVTLNVHGEVAGGLAGNIRMFEATGMGALLVTEEAPNLRELFEPDREVVAFSTADDLVEKVQHLIRSPDEVARLARFGQERTLKEHSTVQRAVELEALLTEAVSSVVRQ